MSLVKNSLIHKIILLEERNRAFWSVNFILLSFILIRFNYLHGAVQFLISLLIVSLFVLLNLLKSEKESLFFKANRNTKSEIVYFSIVSIVFYTFIKTNYAVVNFKNFNLFFGFLSSLVFLYLSLRSHRDRIEHTSGRLYAEKCYIGSQKKIIFNKPYFIQDNDRLQHLSVFGVTGSGKTISVLNPLIKHDIQTNKFTIILDPKGDVDFRNFVYSCCKKYGRDFKFISIGRPDISDGYNPFGFGDANAVKDKILSSTDWSEQFYKKIAGNDLQKALLATFNNSKYKKKGLNNGYCLDNIIDCLPKNNEKLEGLVAHLETMKFSSFSKILQGDQPTLYDYYEKNSVLYFSLDSLTLKEMAKGIGRIFLQDLGSLGGHIFANIPKDQRKAIAVHVDEMATFYTPDFDSILSQIRGANVRLSLANQSIGDYERHGPGALKTITDNTFVKIFMATNDPDSAEYMSRIIGTKEVTKTTKQVDEDLSKETGRGSSRDARQFEIDPDTIKRFKTGEGVLMVKSRDQRVSLDFDSLHFLDIKKLDYEECLVLKNPITKNIITKKHTDGDIISSKKGDVFNAVEWNS